MVKYLASHGNSAALIIDRPIMELLNIDMRTSLEITTDGKNLIVSPAPGPARAKKFKAAMFRVMARHGKTFAGLSKRTGRSS